MNWQVAIFVLLALTILGGFAWYERSKPPSQIVALVAALAALAVAGRVAFSPIPNVLPSTDIILIAGYTLGGAPGFAVGALTGVVSNFWLGQGPWTPWQMTGWGMVGVMGAGLAAASGGRIGRLPLALVCGLSGFAYGALLDYSLMATYGGEQSLDRFLVLSARGLPFNIAHAVGNFTLALIAGPAMVRMLQRYRSRFEFAWSGGGPGHGREATAGAAGVLIALVLVAASANGPQASAAKGGPAAAASWLRGTQNGDGGFGFSAEADSSTGMTAWAALGLEAAGINPKDLGAAGGTPIDYLRDNVTEISEAADIERTVLVLEAAGLDSRHFVGRDLISKLRKQRRSDGSWGGQVNATAFGVLALDSARAGSSGSGAWLVRAQNGDGGWGFQPGTPSDADSTGAVLQALAAAGGSDGAVRRGVAYLRSIQLSSGGFPLSGGAVNAQSTAWAVQGLLAAGVQPSKVKRAGHTPLDYLASVQASDGHYRYSSATDQTPVWVTAQALQAVEAKPFPLIPVSSVSSAAAPSGSGGGSSGAAGASGSGGGSVAGSGSGAAGAAAAGKGGATPAESEYVPQVPGADAAAPARFETEDDDSDRSELIAGIALLVVVACGSAYLLQRRGTDG